METAWAVSFDSLVARPGCVLATRLSRRVSRSWSALRPEVALERPARDLLPQIDPRFYRLPIVDAAPDSCIDDLLHQVAGVFVVARRVQQVRHRAGQVDLDPLGAEERGEYFRLGGGEAAMCRRVLGVVGCREQRCPAGIPNGVRIRVGVSLWDGKLR